MEQVNGMMVRSARRSKNMSQAEIAVAVSKELKLRPPLTRQAISQWEERRSVSSQYIPALDKIFGGTKWRQSRPATAGGTGFATIEEVDAVSQRLKRIEEFMLKLAEVTGKSTQDLRRRSSGRTRAVARVLKINKGKNN